MPAQRPLPRSGRATSSPGASLAKLSRHIRLEHERCAAALDDAVEHAVTAGRYLLEAKARVGHGGWRAWVEENCGFSLRTAQVYMQLAQRLDASDGAKAQRAAHLSLRAALGAVASLRAGADGEEDCADERSVHFSSASPEWYTPPGVVEPVVRLLGGIDLDPCSNGGPAPAVPAARHFTEADDGLARPWSGRVYLNPPYGSGIGRWTGRLREEYERGAVTEAVALVPARTDTAWFAELRGYPRCFLRGRLRFSGSENSAPFPSALFYLGGRVERFAEEFAELGDTFVLHESAAKRRAAS